jgi:hypothetical protein
MEDGVQRLKKAFRLYKARRNQMEWIIMERRTSYGIKFDDDKWAKKYQSIRMGLEIAEAVLEGRNPNWYMATWLPIQERASRTEQKYI